MHHEHNLRRTDLLLDLRCLACDRRLLPVCDADPIRFRCPEGHEFSFDQVRQERAERLERGVRNVVQSWEEKSSLMSRIAQDSLERGRLLVSETFGRDAYRIGLRALRLRAEARKGSDPAP